MYLRILVLCTLLFSAVLTPLTVWAEDNDTVTINSNTTKMFIQLGKLSLGEDFDVDSATSGFGELISTKYDYNTLRHTITFKNGQIITQEASSLHPAIIISMKLTGSDTNLFGGSSGAKTLSGIGIGTSMKKVIAVYGLSKMVSTSYQGAVHIYENEVETVRTTFNYDRNTAKVTSIHIEELYQ